MSLYSQLQEIRNSALLIIRARIKETNGRIHYYDESAAFNGEDLEEDFISQSFELNHYLGDFEGNTIMYPLSIDGGEFDLTINTIDEFGAIHSIDVFEMDADNLCLIADSLTLKSN